MAPSEPSSSDSPNPTASLSNFVPSCGLLLSSAKFEPFLWQHSSAKKPNLGDHIHSSILSAAEKCLGFLRSFASQNPLLAKAAEFHSLCHQIRCRNRVNSAVSASQGFAAVLPGDSVAGLVVANGISNFLNLYNTVLIVRLVLTWFPNAPPAIVSPLSTICDPYLNIFRGLIPPLGGTLDLSPILAFIVLNTFTSAAAALPAELPVASEQHRRASESQSGFFDLTCSQKKWARRLLFFHCNVNHSLFALAFFPLEWNWQFSRDSILLFT